MTENKKTKITYDDLKDPRIDETIARQSKESSVKMIKKKTSLKVEINRLVYIHKRWLYLIIAAVICFLIAWGLVTLFHDIKSPKDRFIEIGKSKYLLSKEAQKYLKIYEVSNYEKSKSIIIIEEPHYSIEGQFSLYKGLEVFFHDNPTLTNKTVFLSEGMSANQPISVRPLIEVDPNPDDITIKKVLESFLITGYIAYAWKNQKDIPILGTEDDKLYRLSSRLWVEIQDRRDDLHGVYLWNKTVAARNKSIANTLIEKAGTYENPILFVGGLHLKKFYQDDSKTTKSDNYENLFSSEELTYLGKENFGIYDYLKKEKIGYTFITSVSYKSGSIEDMERNIIRYTELFKAQQSGNYDGYINTLIAEKDFNNRVTVTPSTEAAAQFLKASGKGEAKNKGRKGKSGKKGNGKKDSGRGGDSKTGDEHPKTPDGKDFNPDEWEQGSSSSEPARGKNKGGTSTETEYTNKKTGEKIWRHTIKDKNGRVTHDHFRYYPKGKKG